MKPSNIPFAKISKVKFGLLSNEDILNESYVEVQTHSTFSNNKPDERGVFDLHLGPPDYSYRCAVCLLKKNECKGHAGHHVLNYPIPSPMANKNIKKFIKIICRNCRNVVVPDEVYLRYPKAKRFNELQKLLKNEARQCVHCQFPNPSIVKKKGEKDTIIFKFSDDPKKAVYPHEIFEVFDGVTDETVDKLGLPISSHPRNLYVRILKIPPVTVRADNQKFGSGKSTTDNITSFVTVLIKNNSKLPQTIDPVDVATQPAKYLDLIKNYYDYVRGATDKDSSHSSLAQSIRGKKKLIRQAQLGKRVRRMCRSTIINNPHIKIDEVKMPLKFCKTIQLSEKIQEYNKQTINTYLNNGEKQYPGSVTVILKSTKETKSTDLLREKGKLHTLSNGDTVMRDMVKGDIILLNRQPTLMPSNISGHRIVPILDPEVKTIQINVIACAWFGADFDGDAINGIPAASTASRAEMEIVSSSPNWLISHITSSPAVGQTNDSILGLFELTKSDVFMDKYNAMLTLKRVTRPVSITQPMVSGRDIITLLLQETPITFSTTPEFYKENLKKWVKYNPDDTRVEIVNGVHKRGVLDKASLGKGKHGNIYHLVANEYGPRVSLDLMYDMQQVALNFISICGSTIGVKDVLLSQKAKEEVDIITGNIINRSKAIAGDLINGSIIPPPDKTVTEFYEEKQINVLKVLLDDFIEPIMTDVDIETNNLIKMILSGTKGDLVQMFNMVSAIGQKFISGRRMPEKFGPRRTLPYYKRGETDPKSKGYISNPYITGLDIEEYIADSQGARQELIMKSLQTSESGSLERKCIKNTESLKVDNYRRVVKLLSISQLVYGEDGLDTRRKIRVRFPTVLVSEEELEAGYHYQSGNQTYQKFFDQEYARIVKDREKFRKYAFLIEDGTNKNFFSNERSVAFDVKSVASKIMEEHKKYNRGGANPTGPKELAGMVIKVADFTKSLYFIFRHPSRKVALSFHKTAVWLVCMLVRSYLCAKFMSTNVSEAMLSDMLAAFKMRYMYSMIDPGSAVGIIASQAFSQELTQNLLDAPKKRAEGGPAKSVVVKGKEIFAAKDVGKLTNPSMFICVKPEYERNMAQVERIARSVEVIYLRNLTSSVQIFFESIDRIVHPRYAHENELITEFEEMNPLIERPKNLIRWCIRFQLSKMALVLKNITMEYVAIKLREEYKDLYFVYTSELADSVFIRVYMRRASQKGAVMIDSIKKQKDKLLDTPLRGIGGVVLSKASSVQRNEVSPDGSIKKRECYAITTSGTNLYEAFVNKYVNPYKSWSDAILEVARLLGIEAARQMIITQLSNIVDCDHHYYMTIADEMSYLGRVTSIEQAGLAQRELQNVLLRMGFMNPVQVVEDAAFSGLTDTINGITSEMMIGGTPQYGTHFNQFEVNDEFIRQSASKVSNQLDE